MTTKKNKKVRPFAQDFSGETKTQQHFAPACDVNNIVAHYAATGIDPHAERKRTERFGYATSKSFSEAMQNIAEIRSEFESLPSKTRADFGNDPAAWLDSLSEPEPAPDEIVDSGASEDVSETTPNTVEKTDEIDQNLINN